MTCEATLGSSIDLSTWTLSAADWPATTVVLWRLQGLGGGDAGGSAATDVAAASGVRSFACGLESAMRLQNGNLCRAECLVWRRRHAASVTFHKLQKP